MRKVKLDYVAATNGLEALQIFQAEPLLFRVIFMGMPQILPYLNRQVTKVVIMQIDISMPVMDGLTAGRKIREHETKHSIARTRIVALTCFSSPEYQQRAASSGFDKYLIKPVLMKSLEPLLELDPEDFSTGISADELR